MKKPPSVKKPVEKEKLGYLGYLGFLAFLALPLRNLYLLALFSLFLFFLAFKKVSRPTKYALFCTLASVISSFAHNIFSGLFGEMSFLSILFFFLTFIFFFAIPIFLIWRVSFCFRKYPLTSIL